MAAQLVGGSLRSVCDGFGAVGERWQRGQSTLRGARDARPTARCTSCGPRRLGCRAVFSGGSGKKRAGGGGGGAVDPFAAPRQPADAENIGQDHQEVGFVGEATKQALQQGQLELLPVKQADTLLKRFDQDQIRSQRQALKPVAPTMGSEGASTEPAATFSSNNTVSNASCTIPPLRSAAIALSASASNVMLGICASSSELGLKALKSWTYHLGLPKGLLHGMDNNGVPVQIAGPVFIKYNSISGDAIVSGYAGPCRGVVFSPTILDSVGFRQFAYLPLGLFEVDV